MGVRYVLQAERMGHEVPGMRGVYSTSRPGMRAELKADCKDMGGSLRAIAARPRSRCAVLDGSWPRPEGGHSQEPLPFRSQNRTSGRQKARPG